VDVGSYGVRRVVAALEFVQHHLAQSGHRNLLVTQTLNQPSIYSEVHAAASAAQRLSANALRLSDGRPTGAPSIAGYDLHGESWL
jgi:hypothetical protein